MEVSNNHYLELDLEELGQDIKKYIKALKQVEKCKRKCLKKSNSQDFVIYLKNYNEDVYENREFVKALKAVSFPTLKKRYEYIYDEVCEYLDDCFKEQNFCDFKDGKCVAKRDSKFSCGCCRCFKNKVLGPLTNLTQCKYLDVTKPGCSISCISCKLFTCDYLKQKGVCFKIKDIFLLEVFCNPIQKYFLKYMTFCPKEKIIKRLLLFH